LYSGVSVDARCTRKKQIGPCFADGCCTLAICEFLPSSVAGCVGRVVVADSVCVVGFVFAVGFLKIIHFDGAISFVSVVGYVRGFSLICAVGFAAAVGLSVGINSERFGHGRGYDE